MMRPMKLGGEQILFGRGCLEHLSQIPCRKAAVVIGGTSLKRQGILERVENLLKSGGAEVFVVEMGSGEPDMDMVQRGAALLKQYQPDLIVALGGGSVMDGAKAMWILYEHEEVCSLSDLMAPGGIGKLRGKARMCCVPSTSGTASEVSRSIVITDEKTGMKCGIGNMELVPDIAVCDPEVTVSVPPKLTAETGMDALTHAVEALTSTRANELSNVLALKAVKDILQWLPAACENGNNLEAREFLQNASMMAGLAFTNVSLGIVHSMAHALGGYFKISHGLANAVLLPYVIRYNRKHSGAGAVYERVERESGCGNLEKSIRKLNAGAGIPGTLGELIPRKEFMERLDSLAAAALADGCTKTNPVIPDLEGMKDLFCRAYDGRQETMELICYLSNGYPTLEESACMAESYAAAGCGIMEVALPARDPYMDNDLIAGHMRAAWKQCSDYGTYMDSLVSLKKRLPGVRMLLLVYQDTIEEIGVERFTGFCREQGFLDLILTGVRGRGMKEMLMEQGLRVSCYVTSALPEDEVEQAVQSNGFVYLQAKPFQAEGGDGTGAGIRNLKERIAFLRGLGIDRPIYCGVGISTPEDVCEVRKAGADAAFVGSAVLKLLDREEERNRLLEAMNRACRE